MSQSEARAWWADVEHLRETIERRRAAAPDGSADPGDELAARRPAPPEPLFAEAETRRLPPEPTGAAPEPTAAPPEPEPEPARPDPADELATHRRSRAAARRAAFDRDAARRSNSGPTPADRRAAMAALAPRAAASGRRTVQITGRTVIPPSPTARALTAAQSTAHRHSSPRMGAMLMTSSPDRIAMWTVVLAFLLIVVAALSAH
jgi:hypothetical protein